MKYVLAVLLVISILYILFNRIVNENLVLKYNDKVRIIDSLKNEITEYKAKKILNYDTIANGYYYKDSIIIGISARKMDTLLENKGRTQHEIDSISNAWLNDRTGSR